MRPVQAVSEAINLDVDLLEQAIEACDVSITIADLSRPDAPLCFVNQAFLNTTGYAREEIIGRNCRFLQGADTDPSAVEAMRVAISKGEALRVDVLNYRRNGKPFWNALHLSPVLDRDGRPRAYIGLQHDVTEVRAARLAEHHRQKIEALGRMAGGVAHEINNLLQPLISLPELVALDLPEGADQARADLDLMMQSARDAKALVAEILTYTRTAPDKDERLELASAIDGALGLVQRSLAGAVSVSFINVSSSPLQVAHLSRAALQQIITNLVLNAAQAMQHDGAVTIILRQQANDAVIEIRDTGPGVPAAVADKIFEPFFTTKPTGKGAGLGLYVVFDLVTRAGGAIALKSGSGAGACFELRFPLFSPSSA